MVYFSPFTHVSSSTTSCYILQIFINTSNYLMYHLSITTINSLLHLASHDRTNNLAVAAKITVLVQVNTLPRAHYELAVVDRNRQVAANNVREPVRGHVVAAFVVVLELLLEGNHMVEHLQHVAAHRRVRVLVDRDGGGSVQQEQVASANIDVLHVLENGLFDVGSHQIAALLSALEQDCLLCCEK